MSFLQASHQPVYDLFDFRDPVSKNFGLAFCIALSISIFIGYIVQGQKQKIPVPLYNAPRRAWYRSADKLMRDSYQKFRGRPYMINGAQGMQLVLTPDYVKELKSLPENSVNIQAAVEDSLQSKYTRLSAGHNTPRLNLLLRGRLTRSLDAYYPYFKEDLDTILNETFSAGSGCTSLKWYPFALKLIARINNRTFVDQELGLLEEWQRISVNFTAKAFTASAKLQSFPSWSRPLTQYLVPELRQMKADIESCKTMITPILEQKVREAAWLAKDNSPKNMMQWFMETLPEDEKCDPETHVFLQLFLSAVSTMMTANLLSDCMYDLASHQWIQEELRQEIQHILGKEGGQIDRISASQLKKLDSFIREVQRMNVTVVSFGRHILKPVSLSDGITLPAGTKIIAPLTAIARDESRFPNPEHMDPWRFYKLNQEASTANNHEDFTSTDDEYATFGVGRHACPGRFLASSVIKLVLSRFILDFDIRLRPGETRPKSEPLGFIRMIDENAILEFRRRQPAVYPETRV